mgnify:CR=1 FL=1
MKIKLFVDEDVHFALALTLRKRGYDVIHAQEIERKGKSDSEQLQYALENKRCLFSFNVKGFVLLHNEHTKNSKNQDHFGIIVSKQLTIGETIRKLLKVLQFHSHEFMKNQIIFL